MHESSDAARRIKSRRQLKRLLQWLKKEGRVRTREPEKNTPFRFSLQEGW